MREISLHLLDLAQNAAAAVAGMPDARVSIRLIWEEQPDGGQTTAEQPESGQTVAGLLQNGPPDGGQQRTGQHKPERPNDGRPWDDLPQSVPMPRLTLCVADNGRGMTAGQIQNAQSPFYTTRTGRGAGAGIGLGIPLCRAAALRTGGTFSLESAPGRGTRVTAVFCPGHIDCAPLGNLPETLAVIVGGDPGIAFTVSAQVLSAADNAANSMAAGTAEEALFRAGPETLRALTRGFAPGDARTIPQLKQYFTENLSLFLQKGEHGMKSLEELAAIRDKMKQTVETREAAHDATRVTVGMGTSGIAAGARGVLNAFAEEVTKSGLHGVLVTQSGSIGIAGFEPVVEVVRAGAEKVTYVKMTPEKAARVVAEHLANGTPVAEYTIENA